MDPHGDWTDEAQRRLDELKRKIDDHDHQAQAPLRMPSGSDTNDGPLGSDRLQNDIEARLEDYLDQALLRWLPEMYGPRGASDRQAAQAVDIISNVLERKHSDRWLFELTHSGNPGQKAAQAFSELKDSIVKGRAGDFQGGIDAAARARALFLAAGNRAGALRSEFELIYDLHRTSNGPDCLSRSKRLETELSQTRFRWLQTQTALELYICFGLVNDTSSAELSLNRGIEESRRSGFTSLTLRGLGLAAYSSWRRLGNSSGAWDRATEGLRGYWGAPAPFMRAYQFYGTEQFIAEDARQFQLALILAREALGAVKPMHDTAFESIAHFRLAEAAIRAGVTGEAQSELSLSSQLLNSLPETHGIESYRAFVAIRLANLMRNDKPEVAFSSLSRLANKLEDVSNPPLFLDLYVSLALAARSTGRIPDAENAFRRAVSYAWPALTTLQDPRDRLGAIEAFALAYREYAQLTLATNRSEEALALWESYRNADFVRNPGDAEPSIIRKQRSAPGIGVSELTTLRSQLRFETVVSFMQVRDGIYVWVFDDRGVRSHYLPLPANSLRPTVLRFLRNCSDPNSDISVLQRDAKELYTVLVRPWISEIPEGRSLVLEVDGDVALVPFRALIDESGSYFSQRRTLILSPGLLIWNQLKSSQMITRQARVLIVAVPNPRGIVAPTFDVDTEASAVANNFTKAAIVAGKNWQYDALRAQLGQADIFHFVGHTGYIRGIGNDLLLAEDGGSENNAQIFRSFYKSILQHAEIRHSMLAVLSACATAGLNPEASGYHDDLVRDFLLKGVPNVVATRWNVDSSATTNFMGDFYSSLMQPSSVNIALEDAAQHLRQNPPTVHPYYWAAFEIFGRNASWNLRRKTQ